MVNLGDDADTTGAIYGPSGDEWARHALLQCTCAGQLAGAFYGASALPQRWVGRIFFLPLLLAAADALAELAPGCALRYGSARVQCRSMVGREAWGDAGQGLWAQQAVTAATVLPAPFGGCSLPSSRRQVSLNRNLQIQSSQTSYLPKF